MRSSARITIAATLLLATSLPSYAENNGWYLGVDVGAAQVNDWCSEVPSVSVGGSFSCRDDGIAGSFYGGYQFNRFIGFQGGIVGFSEVDADFTSSSASADVTGSAYGVTAVAVGTLPLGDKFAVFAKGGVAYMYSSISGTATAPGGGTIASVDSSGWDGIFTFGAGVEYDVWDRYTVRLTWDRYLDVGREIEGVSAKSDVDMISVGLIYHF
jgi:OmpA-OmpF porin, OOP family